MIDTSVYNNSNASDEDVINCKSQTEESDCYLCPTCQHFSKCVNLSLKHIAGKMLKAISADTSEVLFTIDATDLQVINFPYEWDCQIKYDEEITNEEN